jgi:hypothetical protein
MNPNVEYIFCAVHNLCRSKQFRNHDEVASELRRMKVPLFKQSDANPSLISERHGHQRYRWHKHHVSTALLIAYLDLDLPVPK